MEMSSSPRWRLSCVGHRTCSDFLVCPPWRIFAQCVYRQGQGRSGDGRPSGRSPPHFSTLAAGRYMRVWRASESPDFTLRYAELTECHWSRGDPRGTCQEERRLAKIETAILAKATALSRWCTPYRFPPGWVACRTPGWGKRQWRARDAGTVSASEFGTALMDLHLRPLCNYAFSVVCSVDSTP